MNRTPTEFETAIEAYHKACLAVLDLIQEESEALQAGRLEALPPFAERRKRLLGQLETTQRSIRETAPSPVPAPLRARIQATADVIQRAVKLDRQNEQWWLRHQLVPPEMIPLSGSRNPQRVRSTYSLSSTRPTA